MNNESIENIINMEANKGAQTNNDTMVKKTLSVSVSEDLFKRFRKCCEDKCINRSALFEKWIKKYLDGEGEG